MSNTVILRDLSRYPKTTVVTGKKAELFSHRLYNYRVLSSPPFSICQRRDSLFTSLMEQTRTQECCRRFLSGRGAGGGGDIQTRVVPQGLVATDCKNILELVNFPLQKHISHALNKDLGSFGGSLLPLRFI